MLNTEPGLPTNPVVARERPIIFSAPMVRALLDGKKTMTRRLATSPLAKCQPGDRLWVRESFVPAYFDDGRAGYRADWTRGSADFGKEPRWRPSIHMPRVACRLTLSVSAVRIERLQEITEADARAEGCLPAYPFSDRDTARKDFMHLWDELHGSGAWNANPGVVAISFVPSTGPANPGSAPNTDDPKSSGAATPAGKGETG